MSAARERANERLRSIDAAVFNLRGQKFNLQPSDPSVAGFGSQVFGRDLPSGWFGYEYGPRTGWTDGCATVCQR